MIGGPVCLEKGGNMQDLFTTHFCLSVSLHFFGITKRGQDSVSDKVKDFKFYHMQQGEKCVQSVCKQI